MSPGVVAEAEELSQEEEEEEEGELGPQALVVLGPDVFWLISAGLQIVWFQQTLVFPFSLRSTEDVVEMLERGKACLGRGAVSLVLSEAVMSCPGFPKSCPWVMNLRAVLVCHSLSVAISVGRAQLRLCPLAEVFVPECVIVLV